MPVGVTTTITPPPSAGGALSGDERTYFLAGRTERGDTVLPVVVHSFAEAQDLLGRRVTYGSVFDDLQTFFGECGDTQARAVVARVVGPAATTGLLNLVDTAATPVQTLRVSAKDPGPWSANVTVEVQTGSLANTFTLLVTYLGLAVEKFTNLASPAAAATALATSSYIRGLDLGSVTVAPGNNPAVLAPTALSAGVDDGGSVTATTLLVGLNRITADYGPGVCSIPGQPYTTVAAGLAAHAVATNRIALTAPAAGTAVSSAGPAARGLRTSTGSERLGFLYPWITIPDGSGGLRTISPEGFAAGRRAETVTNSGTWQDPAGEFGAARFAVGVERALTTTDINTLADDAVSAVRLYGSGPRLYGWRSLSVDEARYRSLSTMDLLNSISWDADQALEQFVFQTIDSDGNLLTEIANELEAILLPIAEAGGLYANGDIDPGYSIDVGPSVNSPATLAVGQVRAFIGVRDAPGAELIRVFLTKVTLTGAIDGGTR